MPNLVFTDYARRRMAQRRVTIAEVAHRVDDVDRVIHRRDGRTEYSGEWHGRFLLVIAIGDIEVEDEIPVLNVIEDVRRRR